MNTLKTCKSENLKRKRKIIPFEVVKAQTGKLAKDAAACLGVSQTQLKRICRDQKIRRWPQRRVTTFYF